MSTSANVVEYRITKDNEEVGTHRQNILCKTNWDELCQFLPLDEHMIQAYGLDEYEAPWEGELKNLEQFLIDWANMRMLELTERGELYHWANTYNNKTSQGFSSKTQAITAYHCGCLEWNND